MGKGGRGRGRERGREGERGGRGEREEGGREYERVLLHVGTCLSVYINIMIIHKLIAILSCITADLSSSLILVSRLNLYWNPEQPPPSTMTLNTVSGSPSVTDNNR